DLRAAVTAAEEAAKLSDSLYRTGLTDFQNVLDMQRQLASNRDDLAQGIGAAASALVGVWKAFAGPDTPSPAAEEPHAESAESESHAEAAEFAETVTVGGGSGEAEPPPVETHAEAAEAAE
ncbi:MAG: hypothetical protein II839_13115, partial [Kiritimatiellae bacterium]|nr:hypothetical protein [Kiritimatiellia bacterium]